MKDTSIISHVRNKHHHHNQRNQVVSALFAEGYQVGSLVNVYIVQAALDKHYPQFKKNGHQRIHEIQQVGGYANDTLYFLHFIENKKVDKKQLVAHYRISSCKDPNYKDSLTVKLLVGILYDFQPEIPTSTWEKITAELDKFSCNPLK